MTVGVCSYIASKDNAIDKKERRQYLSLGRLYSPSFNRWAQRARHTNLHFFYLAHWSDECFKDGRDDLFWKKWSLKSVFNARYLIFSYFSGIPVKLVLHFATFGRNILQHKPRTECIMTNAKQNTTVTRKFEPCASQLLRNNVGRCNRNRRTMTWTKYKSSFAVIAVVNFQAVVIDSNSGIWSLCQHGQWVFPVNTEPGGGGQCGEPAGRCHCTHNDRVN